MSHSGNPHPDKDDSQQLAAQHQQEQFTSKVQQISKRGRRGNRMVGAFLMVLGAGLLVFTIVRGLGLPADDLSLRGLRGIMFLVFGSFITMGAGLATWRGTFTRRRDR